MNLDEAIVEAKRRWPYAGNSAGGTEGWAQIVFGDTCAVGLRQIHAAGTMFFKGLGYGKTWEEAFARAGNANSGQGEHGCECG